MKKGSIIALVIIVIIVLVGGGYAIFHKSSPATTTATSTNTPKQNATASNTVFIIKTNSTVGQYLADPSGRALYTYGGDSAGTSNCSGSCLANWPAYQAKGSTANLPANVSTIKRSDNGEIQYTYMGMPLYHFSGDSSGQVTGDGVSNFHVATPSGSSASSSSSSTTTSPSNASSQSDTNSNSSSSSSSSGYPY